jgi:hypothetical protein
MPLPALIDMAMPAAEEEDLAIKSRRWERSCRQRQVFWLICASDKCAAAALTVC